MTKVVAVTASRRTDEGRERVSVNSAYVRALIAVGLVPVVSSSLLDPERAPALLDRVDGVLLTGGEDVDPACYHVAPHPKLERIDAARDAVELALIAGARARRLPLLGICRGIQILNVAYGGTLFQDLESEHPTAIDHADEARRHDVRLDAGSQVHRIVGALRASVNSRHHQAVRQLGPGLRATAWADDGIVEAVEPENGSEGWMLAVQWHPEDDTERALFQGFADALGR
jgi:putative glutamine amidotransferase